MMGVLYGFVRVYPISLMMGGVASMFMGRRIDKHDFHQTEAPKRSKFHKFTRQISNSLLDSLEAQKHILRKQTI